MGGKGQEGAGVSPGERSWLFRFLGEGDRAGEHREAERAV